MFSTTAGSITYARESILTDEKIKNAEQPHGPNWLCKPPHSHNQCGSGYFPGSKVIGA